MISKVSSESCAGGGRQDPAQVWLAGLAEKISKAGRFPFCQEKPILPENSMDPGEEGQKNREQKIGRKIS